MSAPPQVFPCRSRCGFRGPERERPRAARLGPAAPRWPPPRHASVSARSPPEHPSPSGPTSREELRRQARGPSSAGPARRPRSSPSSSSTSAASPSRPAPGSAAAPSRHRVARIAVTGETVKPRQLWRGQRRRPPPRLLRRARSRSASAAAEGPPVRFSSGSARAASGSRVLTNGRQWRLVFAGLDFDAWCEWDVDLWFEEGDLSPQVTALRTLLSPQLWTPTGPGLPSPLLAAILDSRKGQAELSAVLGERVREAVELLVQAHGEVLKERCADVDPADIYRAAVRVVMRLVVVLFAESRELLPRDNALYHGSYGLTGLLEELERASRREAATGSPARGTPGHACCRSSGSSTRGRTTRDLPVPAYGGELFAPGDPASRDGLSRALAVFESACFDRELLPDRDVHRLLELHHPHPRQGAPGPLQHLGPRPRRLLRPLERVHRHPLRGPARLRAEDRPLRATRSSSSPSATSPRCRSRDSRRWTTARSRTCSRR